VEEVRRARTLALVGVVLLEAVMPASAKVKMLPALKAQAAPAYLAGAPMLVAVTFDNDEPGSDFRGLPEADLLDDALPFDFTFTDEHGRKSVVHGGAPRPDEPGQGGFTLKSHEQRTMLVLLPAPAAVVGTVRVQVSLTLAGATARAAPFETHIERPSAADAARLAALAAENDRGEPSWSAFLLANWRTVDAHALSPAARKAVALHLFLHRAIYAAEPAEKLDVRALADFAAGPTEGEARLLELEILRARHDAGAAALQAAIEQRFPGLKWRVAEIVDGNGRIADARRSFGAELKRVGREQPYEPRR
jgi:hypothetical protein